MAIAPLGPSHTAGTPGPVMAAARMKLVELCDRLASGWSDEEIVAGIEAAQKLRATLTAWEASAVAEADARGLATKQLHHGSTADWYCHVAGLHRRDAHRFVRHARALVDYTATWAAMRDGRTSPAQAGVICDAVDQLPTSPALRAEGEAFLVGQSRHLTATELVRAGRHLVHVVDPDRSERRDEEALDREERAAHLQRFLSLVYDGMGGMRIKGRCSAEDGEILKTALLPLTRPAPAADPHDPTCETERDPRDHGARMIDALVQLAQHALNTDVLPECHGARPRVSVTVAYADLKNRWAQEALTDTGLDVSIATVLRWACDAELVPICLSDCGEPLAVGRRYRLVTTAQWSALVARDRHCTFPACTRPPVMCHAHHIKHWVDNGPTDLDNLVLLCGEHHRTVHHTPWEVRLSPADLRPEFLPPPRCSAGAPEGMTQPWIRHRPRQE